MTPPETPVVPPTTASFSTTTTSAPPSAANVAAAIAPAPVPTTTTSVTRSHAGVSMIMLPPGSGDGSQLLVAHEVVPVVPQLEQHGLGVGADLGGMAEAGRGAVELHRRRRQPQHRAGRVLNRGDVVVGDDLWVLEHLHLGLDDLPWRPHAFEAPAPLGEGGAPERLDDFGRARFVVLGPGGRVGVALVGEHVLAAHAPAQFGPPPVRLEHREGEPVAVGGAEGAGDGIGVGPLDEGEVLAESGRVDQVTRVRPDG